MNSTFAYQVVREFINKNPIVASIVLRSAGPEKFYEGLRNAIDETARRNRLKLECVDDPEPREV